MTSSNAEVIVADTRHGICVKATSVTSAKTSNATAAKATNVTSAKAANVATAAKATVSTATAAAAGFRTGGNKAAGKQRTCQDHYQSSSHDILHWMGGRSATGPSSDVGASQRDKRRRRDGLEMGIPVFRLY
jgi:hypothetical protein